MLNNNPRAPRIVARMLAGRMCPLAGNSRRRSVNGWRRRRWDDRQYYLHKDGEHHRHDDRRRDDRDHHKQHHGNDWGRGGRPLIRWRSSIFRKWAARSPVAIRYNQRVLDMVEVSELTTHINWRVGESDGSLLIKIGHRTKSYNTRSSY